MRYREMFALLKKFYEYAEKYQNKRWFFQKTRIGSDVTKQIIDLYKSMRLSAQAIQLIEDDEHTPPADFMASVPPKITAAFVKLQNVLFAKLYGALTPEPLNDSSDDEETYEVSSFVLADSDDSSEDEVDTNHFPDDTFMSLYKEMVHIIDANRDELSPVHYIGDLRDIRPTNRADVIGFLRLHPDLRLLSAILGHDRHEVEAVLSQDPHAPDKFIPGFNTTPLTFSTRATREFNLIVKNKKYRPMAGVMYAIYSLVKQNKPLELMALLETILLSHTSETLQACLSQKVSNHDETLLHVALRKNHFNVARILIQHGVNLLEVDDIGKSCCDVSLNPSHFDIETVKLMLATIADGDAQRKFFCQAMMAAKYKVTKFALISSLLAEAKKIGLLGKHPDLLVVSDEGAGIFQTYMQRALSNDRVALFNLFIEYGANPDYVRRSGKCVFDELDEDAQHLVEKLRRSCTRPAQAITSHEKQAKRPEKITLDSPEEVEVIASEPVVASTDSTYKSELFRNIIFGAKPLDATVNATATRLYPDLSDIEPPTYFGIHTIFHTLHPAAPAVRMQVDLADEASRQTHIQTHLRTVTQSAVKEMTEEEQKNLVEQWFDQIEKERKAALAHNVDANEPTSRKASPAS